MKELFHIIASKVSFAVGSPIAFIVCLLVVGTWGITGPLFDYSDSWQLVINTGTTIITFLMVFLIQNTQNRDAKAMQLKLDELIRASKSARDSFIDLEDITDEELHSIDSDFKKLHEQNVSKATKELHSRLSAEKHRRSVR